jgi:GTP-binding protein LepA
MEQSQIRNFCIIAHIDHGKSTLADRLLELTGTVAKRDMKEQILDQMDLERERGITIKLAPVRMNYKNYVLNLIDTPGHVDFAYEVSRSLAAVEGAILLVDATQGIQAQTLANLYLALEQNLTIIPVVNKIDLPNARVEKTVEEIVNLLGCKKEEVIMASAKTGLGVADILEAIISHIPSPRGETAKPLRALIFDSNYNEFKGVVAYVRVVDGEVKAGDKILMMATRASEECLEVGILNPKMEAKANLAAGDIGYIVTGFKEVEKCRVGDTVTKITDVDRNLAAEVQSLPGYKEVRSMVFAGVFPKEGNNFNQLREGILKLKLSDASLVFEPEHSAVLGFGFRCGFLGLLHLEIFIERLKREYNLDLIVTVPSVAYQIVLKDKNKKELIIKSALELPDPSVMESILEPIMKLDIITPSEYLGQVMQLAAEKRGIYLNTEYLNPERAILHYKIPLASILVDFYDKLKSASSGYASMNYEFLDYEKTEVVRLNILVAEEAVEALSSIVYEDEAQNIGRKIVESLKNAIPKQMFEVKIQAAIGGKIVASERISPLRKDVIAKLSGGDYTRKRKLLEKQKEGKKKMKEAGRGRVDIPPEAFLAVLKR